MTATTLTKTPSNDTLVQPPPSFNEKDLPNTTATANNTTEPCNHQHNPTSGYPNLTRLLQTPTARTVIAATVAHLQRILDDDTCTACAVESGVKSATEGVVSAKKAAHEKKAQRGWWGMVGKGDDQENEKSEWEWEGWDKQTVKAAGKEVKGLVKGVKAEMRREKEERKE